MVISLILYAIKGNELVDTWKFSSDMFFNWFLPPIVLNAGFNMYKQKFFENLGNVGIFGVCVTFVCFGLYSVMSVLLLKWEPTMSNYYALNHNEPTEEENPQVIVIPVM
jgi:NhaP-type Na+/H+ or K+/H+ antiporter